MILAIKPTLLQHLTCAFGFLLLGRKWIRKVHFQDPSHLWIDNQCNLTLNLWSNSFPNLSSVRAYETNIQNNTKRTCSQYTKHEGALDIVLANCITWIAVVWVLHTKYPYIVALLYIQIYKGAFTEEEGGLPENDSYKYSSTHSLDSLYDDMRLFTPSRLLKSAGTWKVVNSIQLFACHFVAVCNNQR